MLLKWKTITVLLLLYTAVLLNWNWPWGVLFITWCFSALYSGQTYLVEVITRNENPLLFWLINSTWIVLSFYLIVVDVLNLLET